MLRFDNEYFLFKRYKHDFICTTKTIKMFWLINMKLFYHHNKLAKIVIILTRLGVSQWDINLNKGLDSLVKSGPESEKLCLNAGDWKKGSRKK